MRDGIVFGVIIVLALGVAFACGGDDDSGVCPLGSEGCRCLRGGCDGEPVCVDGVCVRLDADADADGDADGPATCSGGFLDPATSLCWEEPPDDFQRNWDAAMAYCSGLSLGGYGPGSWHLPTISELRSLIRGCPSAVSGGPPCDYLGGPGAGGAYWPSGLSGWALWYWSSSTSSVANFAFGVYFCYGSVVDSTKSLPGYVRCVRPGP
jgi:hypothetical protein